MEISFPNQVLPKVTAIGTISFQTLVDGDYVWCEITLEALRDHFGSASLNPEDLLYTFHNCKSEIHQTTSDYLRVNGGRPVMLVTANFK